MEEISFSEIVAQTKNSFPIILQDNFSFILSIGETPQPELDIFINTKFAGLGEYP